MAKMDVFSVAPPTGSTSTENSNMANENTLLLAHDTQSSPQTDGVDGNSTAVESIDTTSDIVLDDAPWPYTFERSISLLAGPKSDIDDIDRITRSPRVVPVQAAAARNNLRKLGRGYHTPDPRAGGGSTKGSESPDPSYFRLLKKTQSLDFSARPATTDKMPKSIAVERETKLKTKMAEAAAYRAKILSQSAGDSAVTTNNKKHVTVVDDHDEEAAYHSPGYHREKQSDKHKQKQRDMENKHVKGNSTFSQCVFNMSNILMGVGMLGLPFIFKAAGWIGGFLVTTVFAAVTWRTSILIGRELNGDPRPSDYFDDSPFKSPLLPGSCAGARMRAPIRSFPDIARESFGQTGAIILSCVLYFELFSCLAIFLVSLGDHLHTVIPLISTSRLIVFTSFALTIPTTLLRTPRLLSYLSAVGTVCTIFVVLAVFSSSVLEGDISEQVAKERGIGEDAEPYHILWRTKGLPLALGLIAYTFSGHAIVPSIYSSMERPQDFEKMIHYTYIIVLSCCLLVAISGYYMFGSLVDDQITISLDTSSNNPAWSMELLTWLMILTAFSKFTLSMFPLSLGMEEIVAPIIHSENTMQKVSSAIKMILIVLAALVSINCPSFSFLCSLVGLICTMIVSVIFPAAAHLKMFGPHLGWGETILDWLFVITGLFAAIIGTIATV